MVSWLNKENITALMLEMVEIQSFTGTEQEKPMSRKMTEILNRIGYIQENPQLLFENEIKGDPLGRSYVAALVKGGGSSSKTVILINHYDVVGVQDYGNLKDLAFKPVELTQAFTELALSGEASRDLKTGNYLFGRGTADMKGGAAVQLAVLQHFSREEAGLAGNILFLSVPDEENESAGMIAALPFLNELAREHGLEFEAVINCEPAFPEYVGDEGKYFYTGSMGKSIVMFYCYGKETHVGDAMSGLNGNLLVSELNCLLEGNTDFCEQEGDMVSQPPTCLKQLDFKTTYSVQIPHSAASYYNLMLLNSNPEQVCLRMKELAQRAFFNVRDRLNEERKKHAAMKARPFIPVEWEPRVYSYTELFARVVKYAGEQGAKEVLSQFRQHQDTLDKRELAIKVVDRLHELYPDKNPKIIVGFLPPYYPHVKTEGNTEKEGRVLTMVKEVTRLASTLGEDIKVVGSFPGLSDLSFFNVKELKQAIDYVKPNMPCWGHSYSLPLEEMETMQIPTLNFSVCGKDMHKYTERIETHYSFEVLPGLLTHALISLLGKV